MPIEQMNISLSPQMARFIRDKVRKGEYTNRSEVVRDAVRRLQEAEAARRQAAALAKFESGLARPERDRIRRRVQQGIQDIASGHYEDYDADGLRRMAREVVADSVKKTAARSKAR